MEFRDSFSTLKKKAKHRITGKKSSPDKTEANVDGLRLDPGSDPHVFVGGSHDQEGNGANADGGQVLSTIQLPQPDERSSVPARASGDDQERRADVDVSHIRTKNVQRMRALAHTGRSTDKSVGNRIDQLSRHSEITDFDFSCGVEEEGLVSVESQKREERMSKNHFNDRGSFSIRTREGNEQN